YKGLLGIVGLQLGLEGELAELWRDRKGVGPMQRGVAGVREGVLGRLPPPGVVFVGGVDVVRSLPFPTHRFFAGIRECYNRRAEAPALSRLTFCLLGVASPSDLIRDTRVTPFNIGVRVELDDFTRAEARALADGFHRAPEVEAALLGRVY